MDAAWNDFFIRAEHYLREAVGRIFNAEDPLCLVIPKGKRLIAASLLDPSAEAPFHLVSGPSVLMEYHNCVVASGNFSAQFGRALSIIMSLYMVWKTFAGKFPNIFKDNTTAAQTK